VLVLSLIFSILLISVSAAMVTRLSAEKNQLEAQRDAFRDQYRQLEAEKQGIQEFQPLFEQLQARKLVGAENRLAWIEQIRHIQAQRKLLPLTYEIAAQQLFLVDPSVPMGDFELRGSKMVLRMQLLHEMDLFNFLEDLKGVALHSVQSCQVGESDAMQTGPLSPRFEAKCTLFWITLGMRADPEVSPDTTAP
jgi:hypothetical protein